MLYRFKIIPRSPLITPLMSDTLFGHLCWAILYKEGETYLTDFLSSYEGGKPAPVLFSSAFPENTIPRPSIPSLGRSLMDNFIKGHFGDDKKSRFEGSSKIKIWKKRSYIPLGLWLKLRDNYAEDSLYESFIEEDQQIERTTEVEVAASNTINRISGTVSEEGGGLFQREKIWYHEGVVLDLYVEINEEKIDNLMTWFLIEYLPENGFGADKSTGMGSLDIVCDNTFDPAVFLVENSNARLSLSMAAFPGIGEYDAFYRLHTKFGKLGGSFSISSPSGGDTKPFKKPILMYEPGAVFVTEKELNNRSLLDNVHSDSRIRHCGIHLTLPFTIREETYHALTAA